MGNVGSIRAFIDRYHLSELGSIGSSLVMTIISYAPAWLENDPRQIAVAHVFLVFFELRLILFIWNLRTRGTENEVRSQAKMMIASAVTLILLHATILIAVRYQLLYKEGTPLMASTLPLAIAYGVYAFARIALSLRKLFSGARDNPYTESLAYISWISAFYSLTIFTNYLLITQHETDYTWLKNIMIGFVGLFTLQLAIVLLVKGVRMLRTLRAEALES
ncbi:MAG: hypothetical protein Q4B54_14435 [Coriobacteriales bacterium]|nr:hypothetical protein [Coriobacteriales bacterium]